MPDYKEMYLTLFRVCEQAVQVLIKAQQECEEMYIDANNPERISLLEDRKSMEKLFLHAFS